MDIDNGPNAQTIITQGPNQVLHVRQDSASEMEALFNPVINPNFKSKSLPMKARNLPKSFFVQPDKPRPGSRYYHSHSKSMGVLSGTTPTHINHSRSSSSDSNASHPSPAGITNVNNNNGTTLSSLVRQPGSPRNGNMTQKVGYSLSPAQRRAVAHNQFTNTRHHSFQVPQVSHSRSKSSPASLQLLDLTSEVKVSDIPPDMPLPPGWAAAKTQDGQHYFMNHTDRSTTWEDPRIEVIKQQRRSQFASMQRQSLQSPPNQPPMHNNNVPNELSMEPLPAGWEQTATPQGEVYYINHQTRSTSWVDPRLQNVQQNNPDSDTNAQLQQQLIKINQMDIAGSGGQGRGGSVPPQQQSMISHLVQEKGMMRRQLLKQQLSTGGLDPFLGGGVSSNFHQRDASLDSGVEMGNNFNHPRTSEEFLGNLEEMDTGGDVSQRLHGQNPPRMAPTSGQHIPGSRFPEFLDSLPASTVDFSNPNTGNPLNQQQIVPQTCPVTPGSTLDGVGIVSSLQDTFSQDFDVESMLNHVKTENVDNGMIWL